jgi:hypothetical protein
MTASLPLVWSSRTHHWILGETSMHHSEDLIVTSVTLRESHRDILSVLGRISERTASAEMRVLIEAEAARRAEEIAAHKAANPKKP